MAVSPPPVLTVEDYRDLPETGPRYQLIKGELFMSPAPTWYHQIISRNIQFALLKYLEKHPGGELLAAPFDVFLTNHDDDGNVSRAFPGGGRNLQALAGA